MKTTNGDLLRLALEGEFDVIVHGCNCFHTMGAGIARAIASAFPEAVAADKSTSPADKQKLGTVSVADVIRGDTNFKVVNAYTQYHYKGKGPKVDYDAVSTCFSAVATRFANARIGYPMIGAGLAGGDWNRIAPRIDEALAGMDHTLVVLPS